MFDNSDPTIINSNGQRYFVGWDDYGWFSIVAAEPDVNGELEIADWDNVSSFKPGKAERIAEVIEDGPD
jgi:hypothetical protein